MSETAQREVVFWDCDEGAEELTWTEIDEAIERELDGLLTPQMTAAEAVAALPETLTVYGWARAEVVWPDPEDVLEEVMSRHLEEYGDPDGYSPTRAQIDVAKRFLEELAKVWEPWSCEVVEEREIEVLPWVREHNPEWLEEPTP